MLSNRYSTILKVAIPLMAGTFIQSVVMITDAAFLSRFSTVSFDAAGNAGLIYLTLFMGLTGLGDAAQIVIAKEIGTKKFNAINSLLQSSFMLNLAVGLLFFILVVVFIPALLNSYSLNINIANEQVDFLSIRSFGFFAAALMLTLNAYFMAIGKTWVIFMSTIIFAVSNIILDYLLVFGFGEVNAMGIKGAAIASVIAEWLSVITLFILFFMNSERKKWSLLLHLEIAKNAFVRLLKVGSPLVVQGFFALATWTVFFAWIEQLGTYQLTVSQNIRAVYFLAFIPIFGFAATTRTFIAQYIKSNRQHDIPIIIKRIQWLTVLFLILFFHGALFYPEKLILAINPSEVYLADSVSILRFIFGSILLFGIATPLFQTINGSGNTRVTLLIEIISISVYLIFAYLFVKSWELSIIQIWFVEYIYFGSILIASFIYLRFFEWKKKNF